MLIPKATWNGFVQIFYWPKMFSCWLGALANMSWYCCVILSEFSLPSFLKETILLKCCSRFTFIKSKILVFYYDFFFLKKKDIYIPYKEIRKKKIKKEIKHLSGSEATFGHPPLPLPSLFKKIEALLFVLWQISTW